MSRPPARPCACRGWIDPASDGDIPAAVEVHNASDRHTAWRFDRLMAGELVTPETPAEHVRRMLGIPVPAVRLVATDPELVNAGRPKRWDGEL